MASLINGLEFEQALGVDGQESLMCCRPWDHKQLGMTERLNGTYVTTSVVGFFKRSLGKFFLILLSE